MKKILTLLMITLSTQAQQKKGFLDRINDGFQKVNTTLETEKVPSSSGGTSRSIFSAGKTIRGEWKEYGAGGNGNGVINSPRNFTYFFEVTSDNTEITAAITSEIPTMVQISYQNGQVITGLSSNSIPRRKIRIQRAGKFKVQIATERNSVGKFQLELDGPITNVTQESFERWPEMGISFGSEGGGGRAAFSPRNHTYIFEVESGTYIDIMASSNQNIKLFLEIQDGYNQQVRRLNYLLDHGSFVGKVDAKGVCKLRVLTGEPNNVGEYNLEIFGKFIKKPERLPSQEQKITQKWTRQSIKHVYTLPAQVGYQEVMLRTTEGECNLSIIDGFGQQVDANRNLHSPGLKNAIFECKTAGNYKVTVETTNPNGGDYELLFFGKFGEISGKNIKVAAPKPLINNSIHYQNGGGGSYTNQTTTTIIDQTTVNEPEPVTSTTVEEVIIRGQVRNQANAQNLRVIYYNLATNEQLGEIPVAANGSYQFALPRGQRYSLQVVGDGEFVASSQNIDLREIKVAKGKPAPQIKNYTVREVVTMPIEAGSTITLNNLFFPNGKYTLLPESYAELNRLTELMEANPSVKVEIAGHTDNVGGDVPNQELSQDRAEAVRSYLLSKGISSIRLRAKGYGKARPVAPNTTEDGKAQNRRVEFVILGK